jgi:hypothetical protein
MIIIFTNKPLKDRKNKINFKQIKIWKTPVATDVSS